MGLGTLGGGAEEELSSSLRLSFRDALSWDEEAVEEALGECGRLEAAGECKEGVWEGAGDPMGPAPKRLPEAWG